MIDIDTKIGSPFKFLNSYRKNDIDSYFGRDKESCDLFELYKDSSIMILHGPSGSGKTSLIFCGLLNKIKRDKKVISIRRNNNLIDSIKKEIFDDLDDQTLSDVSPSQLLDSFFSSHSNLNKLLTSISHTEQMMLDVEEEIIRLKRKRRNTSEQNENNESIITKYKERLKQFIEERKELLKKIKQENEAIRNQSEKMNALFLANRETNSSTLFNPLIIFDQFEELFVYGTKKEINNFGLFLKLIFEYKIPFNIIISLREEYFGHLDQLQSYVPQIFYKKLRLAHPNKETVKNIIEKSFQEFNINQFIDNTQEPISKEEKQKRIALIIDQIKISDSGASSYHLPFLQVYLDRLYKIDYQRTYRGNNQNDIEYLPLEFGEEEIKEFGSIENVLENYIREVNNKIIRNTRNKLNNRIQHKDSVIKFLRHFKTKDDLKKRISIRTENDANYVINDQTIANKIQIDLWGNTDDSYNTTISEIIEALKNKGILTVSTDHNLVIDYVELSHDIIAKVINRMRTEDDFKSLIKRDFESSFDIYEDTQDTGDFLSKQQIDRMNQYRSYILHDDDKETFDRKNLFFEASLEESFKEEKEKKKQQRMFKRFVYYPIIITILLVLSGFLYKSNDDLKKSKIKLENKAKEDGLAIKIHKNMSYALRDYNVDKTSSINYILQCEKILQENTLLPDSVFNIISNFKNDLYKEYRKTPFYHSSVYLGDDAIIESTKTRRSDDVLYVFVLLKNKKLTLKSLPYKEKDAKSVNIFTKNNVVDFEPFTINNKLRTLVAESVPGSTDIRLSLLDMKGKSIQINNQQNHILLKGNQATNTNNRIPNIYIEHQQEHSFIIGFNSLLYKVHLNLNNQTHTIKTIKKLTGKVRKIKTFLHDKERFLVLYGKNKLYAHTSIIHRSILENQIDMQDSIHTFKIKNKDTVLLGLKGRIRVLPLKNPEKAQDNLVHDEKINTIDISQGKMLIGSSDNGANLYSPQNMLLKQFIGHTKPIKNVSFVKGNPNFIITSSEDQTIKLWNITPVEVSYGIDTIRRPKNKIQYEKLDTIEKLVVYPYNKNKRVQRYTLCSKDVLKRHTDSIKDIDFSTKGEFMITGSLDNTAIISRRNQKSNCYEFMQALTSHTSDVQDVEFFGDSLVLTASSDHTVQIYRRIEDHFSIVPSLIRHDYGLKSATFSPTSDYITSIDSEGNLKEWNFRNFDNEIERRTIHLKIEN
ncbi:nSTAND1 domain-containing NTPase [Aquimarina pacifica]|uniref:nSTAND1 domain-containing NTPase n=1 Tax=Aquimarina pacifica TaxID=1296415 RepID=UPI00046E791B|nr:hypothetical protein [Aquimarina pacifica]